MPTIVDMKHARSAALDELEPLLAQLRELSVKEKSRGVFYLRSQAFLHFHEDEAGLFADLRESKGWRRMRVSTQKERKSLLTAARAAVG